MTNDSKQKEQQFVGIIEKTTKVLENEKVNEKLTEILEKTTSLKQKEAKKTVNDISETINTISENFKDLQKAKEKGKGQTQWLKEKLDKTIEKYNVQEPEKLMSEIKNSLKDSNEKIGIEIFGEKIDISEPLTNTKYEGLNKTAIVKDFQNEIKNNTLLGAIIFEKNGIKVDKKHKEIKAVKKYFEEQLDSKYDDDFKKGISTATVITQKNGLLPKKFAKKTPDEIAMMVDRGVTASKIAFKLGNGEISPMDAVEYTIDRNVAVLNSAIIRTTTRYGGAIGGKIGGAIGSIFGPAGTAIGTTAGTVVGKVGGYAVGKVIESGVKKVASAVKSVAQKTWDEVKSVASNVWEGVKSLFCFWC